MLTLHPAFTPTGEGGAEESSGTIPIIPAPAAYLHPIGSTCGLVPCPHFIYGAEGEI